MRRLLEGGVYFLSKVMHSNHYHNKLTALFNSNNFHTTFGLIIPGCYRARAKRKKFADIISKELKVMKSKYVYVDFELEQNTISKPLIQRGH